jgi:hypothetical protein
LIKDIQLHASLQSLGLIVQHMSCVPKWLDIHCLPSLYKASIVDASELLPIVFITLYLPLLLSII